MSEKRSLIGIGAFLLVIGCLFYLMNFYTPLISDDYLYSFYLTPLAAKSFFDGTFIGFEQRILSVADIFGSQYNHYFYVNGRTVPHVIEQLFAGIIGKEWFNWINTFFLLLLIVLTIWLSDRKRIYQFPYWIISSFFIWFLLPHPGDIILPMVCAINYVWSAILCLIFLLVYNEIKLAKKVHWLVIVLLFLLGLVAGWTHESLVIGVSGALFINYCIHYRSRPGIPEVLLVVGFWMGTLLVCLSPAAHGRALIEHFSIWKTFLGLLGGFRAFYILVLLLICMLIYDQKHGNSYILKKFFRDNQFYFYAILIELSFSLFIGYWNVRQLFGIELFSVILLMKVVSLWNFLDHIWFKRLSVIIACLIVVHMVCVIPYSKHTYIQSQDMIESYIQSEKGVVYFKKETYPYLLDRYIWRFGDYMDWEISCLSVYYSQNKKQMTILLIE